MITVATKNVYRTFYETKQSLIFSITTSSKLWDMQQ